MRVFISDSRYIQEMTTRPGFEMEIFQAADGKGLVFNLFLVRAHYSGVRVLNWLPMRVGVNE